MEKICTIDTKDIYKINNGYYKILHKNTKG